MTTPAGAAEYPKAFLSNGQVWIQTAASEPPLQATHDADGSFKSDPVVSPSGKLIMYGLRESQGSGRLAPLSIVFIDSSAKEIRRFREVPTQKLGGVCGYGHVEWIGDARIGVRCEYNPSGEDYLVLNAVSGKVEKEFTGLYFSWSPDYETLAHIGWIIHFATPASQNYCVLFNDKPVYTPGCSNEVRPTTAQKKPSQPLQSKRGVANGGSIPAAQKLPDHYENIHEISYPLVWSKDGRNLAFVEMIYDFDWGLDEKGEETREFGNQRSFLAIISTERVAVGYPLTGPVGNAEIEWLSDSRLRLRNSDKSVDRVFDLVADPPKPIP